jgi:hypothetical protein
MITPIARRAVTATFTLPRAVRSITTTQKLAFANDKAVANPNIKVTHFEDGKRVAETVKVEAAAAAPAMQADIPYVATRLKTSTRSTLPNTMKQFTLTGKTAIVSGYVTSTIFIISPH